MSLCSTSGTKLLPSLWNKDSLGAWRIDLDPPREPTAEPERRGDPREEPIAT